MCVTFAFELPYLTQASYFIQELYIMTTAVIQKLKLELVQSIMQGPYVTV